MAPAAVVERRTRLAADSAVVWRRVCTPEGIRHELAPVVRMTMPPGLVGRTIEDAATSSAGRWAAPGCCCSASCRWSTTT